jgi:hypothetical protein
MKRDQLLQRPQIIVRWIDRALDWIIARAAAGEMSRRGARRFKLSAAAFRVDRKLAANGCRHALAPSTHAAGVAHRA